MTSAKHQYWVAPALTILTACLFRLWQNSVLAGGFCFFAILTLFWFVDMAMEHVALERKREASRE